ncbi:IFN protein, partial [Tachuris rubrigastra]|nr:IFN protein [Tachuris rubrigastra]
PAPPLQDPQPYLQHGAPVLLLAFATALACHHLCPCNDTFPKDSFQLLQAMATSPPQSCHHQHTPFAFDILHINHLQHAVASALHILQHLFAILSSPSTPQHWDAQAWQDLLDNLHHYIQHLEQCVPANGMLFEDQGPHNLLINKYFECIQDFLCTHHHRPCAWDHICLEAHAYFQHLHNTCIMRD